MDGDDRYTSPARCGVSGEQRDCARRMYTYTCKWCARPTALLRQHVLLHQRHHAAFGPQHIVLARERDLSALPRAAAVLSACGMEYELAVPVQAEGEVQQAAGKCWLRQRAHGGQGLFVCGARLLHASMWSGGCASCSAALLSRMAKHCETGSGGRGGMGRQHSHRPSAAARRRQRMRMQPARDQSSRLHQRSATGR